MLWRVTPFVLAPHIQRGRLFMLQPKSLPKSETPAISPKNSYNPSWDGDLSRMRSWKHFPMTLSFLNQLPELGRPPCTPGGLRMRLTEWELPTEPEHQLVNPTIDRIQDMDDQVGREYIRMVQPPPWARTPPYLTAQPLGMFPHGMGNDGALGASGVSGVLQDSPPYNPRNLTTEQIGEGYRLLTENEMLFTCPVGAQCFNGNGRGPERWMDSVRAGTNTPLQSYCYRVPVELQVSGPYDEEDDVPMSDDPTPL